MSSPDPHATPDASSDVARGAAAGDRPLQGARVLVTRAADQAGALLDALRALGATARELPLIAFEPPDDWGPLDQALDGLAGYDWVVFTSPNGARRTLARLTARGLTWSEAIKTAAVGPGTAMALAERGVRPALLPDRSDGLGVAEALAAREELAGLRVLLPRGDLAQPDLPRVLEAAGAHVTEVVTYHTVPFDPSGPALRGMLSAGALDWITLASGSAFDALLTLIEDPGLLAGVKLASIGPRTSAVLRARGFAPAAEAEQPTPEALARAIARAAQA